MRHPTDAEFTARIFDLVEKHKLGKATDTKTVIEFIEDALSDLEFERQIHDAETDQLQNG